ncbi:MAG: acyl-CoA thioesterase II [Pseudomonadota bacterium]
MHPVLSDLIHLLGLERIEDNIFRGESRDIGSAQVFGGQVLGQALSSAQHTVDGRVAHSLHAYFLRRGDMDAPIVYEVDRARDGGSFSNRRVVAIQHGRPILNLAASFQNPEQGIEHHSIMPDVPRPDDCPSIRDVVGEVAHELPQKLRRNLAENSPFDIRPAKEDAKSLPPTKQVWFRVVDQLSDDLALHQNLLAYASDYELLGVSTMPHNLPFGQGAIIMASLDHALWFHREFRIDEWLLYSIDSPNASGARGLSRGQFFNADGKLVASVTQEGLVRVVEAGTKFQRSDPAEQK